jgi:hypothetical protein
MTERVENCGGNGITEFGEVKGLSKPVELKAIADRSATGHAAGAADQRKGG